MFCTYDNRSYAIALREPPGRELYSTELDKRKFCSIPGRGLLGNGQGVPNYNAGTSRPKVPFPRESHSTEVTHEFAINPLTLALGSY